MTSLPASYFNFSPWLKRQLLLVPLLTACFIFGMLLPLDNHQTGFGGPVVAAGKSVVAVFAPVSALSAPSVMLAQVGP